MFFTLQKLYFWITDVATKTIIVSQCSNAYIVNYFFVHILVFFKLKIHILIAYLVIV